MVSGKVDFSYLGVYNIWSDNRGMLRRRILHQTESITYVVSQVCRTWSRVQ